MADHIFGKKTLRETLWKKNRHCADTIIKQELEIDSLKWDQKLLNLIVAKNDETHTILDVYRIGENCHIIFVINAPSDKEVYIIFGYQNEGRILFRAAVSIETNGIAKLEDIMSFDEDKGVGSLGLRSIIKFLKIKGFSESYGVRTGFESNELKEKLDYFYDKHGFEQNGARIKKLIEKDSTY